MKLKVHPLQLFEIFGTVLGLLWWHIVQVLVWVYIICDLLALLQVTVPRSCDKDRGIGSEMYMI
jgi:hypothetical protein